MARKSKRNKTVKKKSKKGNQKRYLWQIVLGLSIIISIILISVKPDFLEKEQKKPSGRSAPQFKKEGILTFFNKQGDSITTIDIEIADNDADRAMGLMYRKSMEENQGMLFIMEREEPQSFWMRNTYISLDIIYLNRKLEIVSIGKYTQPQSDLSVPSGRKAKYVIEVVAGFCDRFNIREDDKVTYSRLSGKSSQYLD